MRAFAKEIFNWLRKGKIGVLRSFKYYRKWKAMQVTGGNTMNAGLPWVSFAAIDFLNSHTKPGQHVFEFGGGGSTVYFLRRGMEVTTAEHNSTWYTLLKESINSPSVNPHWTGMLLEGEKISNTTAKDPANPEHYATTDEEFGGRDFYTYASSIDQFPDKHFDFILVDGRARPSCLWHALPKLKQGGYLLLDNAERTYYTANPQLAQQLKEQFTVLQNQPSPVVFTKHFSITKIWRKNAAARP